MRIKLIGILLLLIIALAFGLRYYKITEIPPSLNWDEVSIGYNAYSILKTGRDEWGKFLPLHFKSYGEYKLPAQIYFSIPAIAVLGLNDFALRLTPVVYGTLTVLLLYLLVLELFSNRTDKHQLGLLAALLLAVSPWHIQLTRGSFESAFSVFWVVMGIWLLLKGFRNSKWWIVSVLPFAVSVYTYNSARVFTPLFLSAVAIIFRQDFLKHKKQVVMAAALFALLLVPLLPFVVSGEAAARYKLVSITNEAGLIPRINERRGASTLPVPLPRLVHNKVTYISYYFAKNYLAHFTPNFLFIKGAGHVQHHAQGLGELYYFQAPFLILGIYLLFKRKEKYRWLMLAWLLIAFVPVATTKDSIPNALRTLIAAPWYQIITAYGIVLAFGILRRKLIWKVVLGFLIILAGMDQMTEYLKNYFTVYPIKYSRDWQYGNKQVVEYIKNHYNEYDYIIFSRQYGEAHMFSLFYLGYDPQKFQTDPGLVRYELYDWVRVRAFDKFSFPDLGTDDREATALSEVLKEYQGKKILVIGEPKELEGKGIMLTKINFLDGQNAFIIAEFN